MTLAELLAFAGRHHYLSLGFVGLTLAIAYTEIMRLFRGYKSVSPRQLTELINRDNALVVDVSAINDYDKGHIVGARHVGMSQFDPENKVLANLKDMPVAVVCRNGQTSGEAARRLIKAGFKRVFWLDGGVVAWQQAELPLTKVRGKA